MAESLTREIAAPADDVWAVVSDITRLGEMSPECYECRWDANQQPGLGATFTGRNRLGDKEWSNQATIVEWSPGERLTWEVRLLGGARKIFGDEPFSRWGFTIETVPGGSRVTHSTTDLRTDELKQASLAFLPEVPDRGGRNLDTMAVTVDSLTRVLVDDQ